MRPRLPRPGPCPTRLAALLAALVAPTACLPADPDLPPLACTALVAPADTDDPVTPADTLDVLLQLPRMPEDGLQALLRVDGTGDEGLVAFDDRAPATAAGVGTTLTTAAVFTVCVDGAPRAVVFSGEEAPHGKVWIRVSTDRPVRARVRTGGTQGALLDPPLVVRPGASGSVRWTDAGGDP